MSVVRRNLGRTVLLTAIAVVVASRGGTRPAHAANTATTVTMPAPTSAPMTATAPAAAKDPRIADLDSQIKALRDQFHSQLDPLETQVKALRDKFDPQIASLEGQRHDLVEAAKPPDVRALDDQETAELKQLGDQEKSEVDKVHQRFADERKEVQEKYKQRRQELGKKPEPHAGLQPGK